MTTSMTALLALGYGTGPNMITPASAQAAVVAAWSPQQYNPFEANVNTPNFVTASFVVTIGTGIYTSPPMQMADISTVLGQWFDRLAWFANKTNSVSATALTDKITEYVRLRPALNTPDVLGLCEMCDQLLQACIAASPQMK